MTAAALEALQRLYQAANEIAVHKDTRFELTSADYQIVMAALSTPEPAQVGDEKPRCDKAGSYCKYGNMAKWPRKCFVCHHEEGWMQAETLDGILRKAHADLNQPPPQAPELPKQPDVVREALEKLKHSQFKVVRGMFSEDKHDYGEYREKKGWNAAIDQALAALNATQSGKGVEDEAHEFDMENALNKAEWGKD